MLIFIYKRRNFFLKEILKKKIMVTKKIIKIILEVWKNERDFFSL